MIRNILEMLTYIDGGTELIDISQGKNKMPETLKEGYKQFKKEMKWQKK